MAQRRSSSSYSSSHKTPWTWEQVLGEYCQSNICHPGAAPVSSFRFQNVPLAQHWDQIAVVGTVVEIGINMKAFKNNKVEPDCNQAESTYFWFGKVVQFEGYFVKVRFLGFCPNQENDLIKYDRWVHYCQLKEINHHRLDKAEAALPQIALQPSFNGDELKALLKNQLMNKQTISPMIVEMVKQAGVCRRWLRGAKVEVQNRDCCTEMRIGIISKTCGRRVQVLYCDNPTPMNNNRPRRRRQGIWVHEDSEMIQSPGWTKTVGGSMSDVKNYKYDPAPLSPSNLRASTPTEMKLALKIRVGDLFEFINPIRLNEIAVGKVTNVLSHGYFNCRIESRVLDLDLANFTRGKNSFHYHISSGHLLPLGTSTLPSCLSDGSIVKDVRVDLQWDSYLKRHGMQALALPPKSEEDVAHEYKESMWVEAVDAHTPKLICPAIISEIISPYALKIQFLGWGKEFEQWKPLRSLDIYPIGWSQLSKYPMSTPTISNRVGFPAKVTTKVQQQSHSRSNVMANETSKKTATMNGKMVFDCVVDKSENDSNSEDEITTEEEIEQ